MQKLTRKNAISAEFQTELFRLKVCFDPKAKVDLNSDCQAAFVNVFVVDRTESLVLDRMLPVTLTVKITTTTSAINRVHRTNIPKMVSVLHPFELEMSDRPL